MHERTLEPVPSVAVIQVERCILTGLVIAITFMEFGAAWDLQWHAIIGHSFWSPPHVIIYSGTILTGILGLLAIYRANMEERSQHAAIGLRVTLSRWYGAIGLGSVIMVAAAGIDEVWHRTIRDFTTWSPPHVMGVVGAIVITLGTAIGLLRAGRREAPSSSWARASIMYLSAVLLLAPYFGLLPAVTMVISPIRVGPSILTTWPYLIAGQASLMIPGLVVGYQRVLGRSGLESAALMSIGLWSLQKLFHTVATPLLAITYGYTITRYNFPDLRYELFILGFMLLPALVVNRLPIRQPGMVGAALGVFYTAEVSVLLGVQETALGATGLSMLGTIISGAVVSAFVVLALGVVGSMAGVVCSRWVQGASGAAD